VGLAVLNGIQHELIAKAGSERTVTRTTQRNGYRDRLVTTAAGDVELRIPKLRTGRSSRRCWNVVDASIRRCSRW